MPESKRRVRLTSECGDCGKPILLSVFHVVAMPDGVPHVRRELCLDCSNRRVAALRARSKQLGEQAR